MRHHNKNRKFGREKNQRGALLRSLARSLALRGKMTTTLAKAKEVRGVVEKMITRGKNPTLANRRFLAAEVGEAGAKKIISAAENYESRAGGYLRVVKLAERASDAAPMAIIEFV